MDFSHRAIVAQYRAKQNNESSSVLDDDLGDAFFVIDSDCYAEYIHVAILGGTRFYSVIGEEFCKSLGAMLAQQKIIMAGGGMMGVAEVAEVVTRAFADELGDDEAERLFHLLPRERQATVEGIPDEDWLYGTTFPMGMNWAERRDGLSRWSKLYIMVEGGIGTVHEANCALQNGAIVIPLIAAGGGASGMEFEHDDPFYTRFDLELGKQRFLMNANLNESDWMTLGDVNLGGQELAHIVARIVGRLG